MASLRAFLASSRPPIESKATATSAGASVINGLAGVNMFSYTSPSFGGATITASYLPSSATVSVKSSTAFAIAWSPEMAEGLTVGYAAQDDESGSATTASDDTSESTAYIKYVYGPVLPVTFVITIPPSLIP